jgi:hypothetical protein
MENEMTTKQQLISQIQSLIDLLDFGTYPVSELTDLIEVLEDSDAEDEAIDQAFYESIYGCDTGSSRLIQIGYEADKLDDMVREFQKTYA